MRVTLIRSGNAFLPELAAYHKYFAHAGFDVRVLTAGDSETVADGICYRFGGVLRRSDRFRTYEVHEYHSASIGAFPKIKNRIKAALACQPAGRVFLNEFVRAQFKFSDAVPWVYRDMGADLEFFSQRGRATKRFDVVYAGSVSGRPGLISCIRRLCSAGFQLGIAGSTTEADARLLQSLDRVTYVGRLANGEVPEFVGSGRFGLNFCPNIYPFHLQTSTKVVEYLAAGIPILSNRYPWIESHARKHGYGYVNVDEAVPNSAAPTNAVLSTDIALRFSWASVLSSVDLAGFLLRLTSADRA